MASEDVIYEGEVGGEEFVAMARASMDSRIAESIDCSDTESYDLLWLKVQRIRVNEDGENVLQASVRGHVDNAIDHLTLAVGLMERKSVPSQLTQGRLAAAVDILEQV